MRHGAHGFINQNLVGATAGSMHAFRIFVKCLAVGVGLIGGLWIVAGAWMFFAALGGNKDAHEPFTEGKILVSLGLGFGVISLLGILIIRRVWLHLRRPERSSANDVVGIASFFLALWLFQPLKKHVLLPESGSGLPPTQQILWQLGLILACYLVYRLALKRLVARAYPAGGPPATPTSISAT